MDGPKDQRAPRQLGPPPCGFLLEGEARGGPISLKWNIEIPNGICAE